MRERQIDRERGGITWSWCVHKMNITGNVIVSLCWVAELVFTGWAVFEMVFPETVIFASIVTQKKCCILCSITQSDVSPVYYCSSGGSNDLSQLLKQENEPGRNVLQQECDEDGLVAFRLA